MELDDETTNLEPVTVLLGLAERLRRSRLYFITDLRHSQDEFETLLEEVYSNGVDVVQIRDSKVPRERYVTAVELATRIAQRYNKLAVAGLNVQAAIEAQADAVHLGAADPAATEVKAKLNPWTLIGKSVHSRTELREINNEPGIDYLFVSPVFLGASDMLGMVSYVAEKHPIGPGSLPWFAMGSINISNIHKVINAGARRLGVSGAILNSDRPGEVAAELKAAIVDCWKSEGLRF